MTRITGLMVVVLAASAASGATVVGELRTSVQGPAGSVVRFYPESTPQALGNVTIVDVPHAAYVSNGLFGASNLVGGIYTTDFGPWCKRIRILVPPDDTNVYQFNYCAGLATNLGTFGWTNFVGLISSRVLPGAGAVFVTNHAGAANESVVVGVAVDGLQLPLGVITNAGSAAYSNAAAFDLAGAALRATNGLGGGAFSDGAFVRRVDGAGTNGFFWGTTNQGLSVGSTGNVSKVEFRSVGPGGGVGNVQLNPLGWRLEGGDLYVGAAGANNLIAHNVSAVDGNFSGNENVTGDVTVNGGTTLYGGLTVNQDATLNGDVNLGGRLSAGDVAMNNFTAGSASVADLQVTVGNTSVGNLSCADLTVNGDALFTAGVSGIPESGVTGLTADLAGKQALGAYITDLTGDGSAHGPGSAALTLANSGVTAGTYRSVTVNGKGLVTAGLTVAGESATSWTNQVFGKSYALLGAGVTAFFAPQGNAVTNVTTSDGSGQTRQRVAVPCKVVAFYLWSSAAPGASQSFTGTVMTNGVATGLVATISGGSATSASDTTHVPAFGQVSGDEWGVRVVSSGGAGSARFDWVLLFTVQ